jgi:hypothetical protein
MNLYYIVISNFHSGRQSYQISFITMEWKKEITDDLDLKSIDPLGKWLVCAVCDKYQDPRAHLKSRHDFRASMWTDHKKNEYHQAYVRALASDAKKKRSQTSMLLHFSVAAKRAKSLEQVEDTVPTKSCEGVLPDAYKKVPPVSISYTLHAMQCFQ